MFLAQTDLTANTLREVTGNDLASILIPSVFAFFVGILIAPWLLRLLRRYKMWRQPQKLKALGGADAPITEKLNNDAKLQTPCFGGLIIIIATVLTLLVFGLLALLQQTDDLLFWQQLNFVSRQETWLVIFSLVAGSIIGGLDDLALVGRLNFLKFLKKYGGGGLSLKMRLLVAILIGCICGYWFHFKLGESALQVPFGDLWQIGAWIVPFIVITVTATYSGGIIDGIDGLAGGVFAIIFTTYGLISLLQGSVDLATFCFVVVGGILAFLWFNIPPAKLYMSETGTMALTITLSIVAFMTNTIFLLPIIAFPLVITSLSVILQVFWRKFFKRKLFLVSPLHNYFRAKGQPASSVVMHYWIMAQIMAIIGLVIYLLGYPNNFLQ